MSGLVILFALIAIAGAALALLGGLRGPGLQLTLAALMIGGAGYALQGRPDLPGAPHQGTRRAPPLPLTEPRHAIFGQFNGAERWVIISEALASRGDTREAVGAIRAGLKASPASAELWTMLGNTLVDHAGTLTPAALLAYERAEQFAPKHPGPLFFRGLAEARAGQSEAALATWQRALVLTPATASYRPILTSGIAALGQNPSPGTGEGRRRAAPEG